MPVVFRLIALILALGPLAACSLFGEDGEEVAEAAPAVAEPQVVRMQSIGGIELGRTRDGVVVTAYGLAPGIGYAAPRLEPRRGGRIGTDGFLDFDFVATAPDRGFVLPQGRPQARILRADRLLGIEVVRQATGLRIHAAEGGQQIVF